MALTIACATCRKQLVLPETLLGQLVSCPSCHMSFTVADQSGRLAIRAPGGELAPLASHEAEDIPTVLPAPKKKPFVPLLKGPRPFVFRIKIVDDPEQVLSGPMQARVSGDGLELRDANDYVHQIPVGSLAEHPGGNVLRVPLTGRTVTLRITQNACQQCRLAEDIVLFLTQKRTVPRLKDYRPRLAPRLAAWLPLLLAICLLPFGVAGWIGGLTWLTFGIVLSFVAWMMVRNESRPLKSRFARVSAAWVLGIMVLAPAVPAAIYVHDRYYPPPLTWQACYNSDIWSVSMPGSAKNGNKPLFDLPGERVCQVSFVNLPRYDASFEVWSDALPVEEFEGGKQAEHINRIRDKFLQANPDMQCIATLQMLEGPRYISQEFQFANPGNSHARIRVNLAMPRLVVLKVSWADGFPHRQAADRFFASFLGGNGFDSLPLMKKLHLLDGPKEIQPEQRGPPPWTPEQPRRRVFLTAPTAFNGLIGYWPLDEGMGALGKDLSGKGRDAQPRGGRWIEGISGKAIMFDGKVDFLVLTKGKAIAFPKNTGFTLALWLATKDVDGPLLSLSNSQKKTNMIRIGIDKGFLQLKVGSGPAQIMVEEEFALGREKVKTWHHVAVVRQENGRVKLYRDGALLGDSLNQLNTDAMSIDRLALGYDQFAIGAGEAGKVCGCCLDELCIYGRVLDEKQIQQLAGYQ